MNDNFDDYEESMDLEEDYDLQDEDYNKLYRNGTLDYEQSDDQNNDKNSFHGILFQRTNSYVIHPKQEVTDYLDSCVNELREEFGLDESLAYKILNRTGWIKTKALRTAAEDGSIYDDMALASSKSAGKQFDCPICWTTIDTKDGAGLPCKHLFCKDCFTGHLSNAVSNGDNAFYLTCPSEGCQELVTETYFQHYLSKQLFEKYKNFKLKKIVENSGSFIWCPAPNCENVIELTKFQARDKTARNIRCGCGYCFCFLCRNQAHRPITCTMFNEWMGLVCGKKEYLNELWMKTNTKKCPKCNVDIEKNQGCMHMTCVNCKFEFCWLCKGDWKTHGVQTGGFHACNIYKESQDPQKDVSLKQLEKFDFYRNRYEENLRSITTAEKKRVNATKAYHNLEGVVRAMQDFTFLQDALDLVVESRRAISMTYALGYYMKMSDNKKAIFEMNQTDLWHHLDSLDELTDKVQTDQDIFNTLVDDSADGFYNLSIKFYNFKNEIINKTVFLTSACNNILLHIEQDVINNKEEEQEMIEDSATKKIKKDNKKSKKEQAEHWYCAHCTYANEASAKACEICQKPKKVLKSLSLL